MATNAQNLRRGARLSGRAPGSLEGIFITAVLSGFAGIALGLLAGSKLLTIGLPLLVMAGYIFWIWHSGIHRHNESVGDSCYYLGFILTLISMVGALFELSLVQNIDMGNILGAFGAALITTIAGLVSRLCFVGFRAGLNEAEKDMEQQLADFNVRLAAMTEQVCTHLEVTTARYEDTHRQMGDALANSVSRAEVVLETLPDRVSGSLDNLVTRLDSVRVPADLFSSRLTQCIHPLEQALQSLVNSLEHGLPQISQVLESRLSGVTQALSEKTNELGQSMDEGRGQLVAKMSALVQMHENMNSQLAVVHANTESRMVASELLIQKHLETTSNAMHVSMSRQVSETEKRLAGLGEKLAGEVSSIGNVRLEVEQRTLERIRNWEKALEGTTALVKKAHVPVAAAVRTLQVWQSDMTPILSGLRHASGDAEALSNTINSVSTGVQHLSESLDTLQQKIGRLNTDLPEQLKPEGVSGLSKKRRWGFRRQTGDLNVDPAYGDTP
jgi:Ca2+/Na+ antiporter